MRINPALLLTFTIPLLVAAHCPSNPGCSGAGPIQPSTVDFLGSADFEGCWLPRASNATTGGEAMYNGRLVFLNLANHLVDAVLPTDFRRAAPATATATVHPVILMFGHQTDTKWVIPGAEIEVGDDYQELILMIPFVQAADTPHWHNFVVRMYLNDDAAKYIGNWFFGYAKQDAKFQETATTFTVETSGSAAFTATAQPDGAWQSAQTSSAANFADMKNILDMPILGRAKSGQFVCSYFELNYANAGGEMRPIKSSQQFFKPFTAAMSGWTALGAVSNVAEGAVELRGIEWRLAMPSFPSCVF